MQANRTECECADPGCRVHSGKSACGKPSATILYRVDMEDETGTAFCEECASHAFESGVFAENEDEAEITREDSDEG